MSWVNEKTLRDMSKSLNESPMILEKRLLAFSECQKLAMPEMTQEDWRYTDIDKVKWDAFSPIASKQSVSLGSEATACTLDEAAKRYPEIIKNHLGSRSALRPDKLSLLASSLWNTGTFIHIPAGKSQVPISITTNAGNCTIANTLIVVERGASVKIVEDFHSSAPGLHIGNTEIYVGDGAAIEYYYFEDAHPSYFDFSQKRAFLSSGARIDWIFGNFGGEISATKIETFFEGSGSHAEQKGVFFGNENQHINVMTNAHHRVPNTSNNINVRGVLKDTSSSIYHGLIKIEKSAQQTNSYLSEHSLMIGKNALANSIPSLEIDANDVKASHGSTTGKIDEEQIFYLMSRGLTRGESERLIIEGFFIPIIEKIPLQEVRERIEAAVNRKMDA